jgi:hypothetical protein
LAGGFFGPYGFTEKQQQEDTMGHIRGALLIMVGVLLTLAPGVRADSLQLKNGNLIQGKYMGGTDRAVQFEVNGKMRLYDIEQILSISFAAASVDGGMPSNSAEAGHGRNAEGCVAAKSSAPSSTAKSQLKSVKMQSTQNGLRSAGKSGSGRGMGLLNRPLRTNWARAGDCDSTPDTSFVGARFAWLPRRIDVFAA